MPGKPEPEFVIAGYARLLGSRLDDEVLGVLRAGLGEAADGEWGAVFIYEQSPDAPARKWTFFTAEADYAKRLAVTGGRIPPHATEIWQRFPAFCPGWIVDNGSDEHAVVWLSEEMPRGRKLWPRRRQAGRAGRETRMIARERQAGSTES